MCSTTARSSGRHGRVYVICSVEPDAQAEAGVSEWHESQESTFRGTSASRHALPYIYGIGLEPRASDDPRVKAERRARARASRTSTETEVAKPARESSTARLQGRRRPAPRGAAQHQAPHGHRLLPRAPSPPRPAGAGPVHQDQRPHPQGTAPYRRRQEEGPEEVGGRAHVAKQTTSQGKSPRKRTRRSLTEGKAFIHASATTTPSSPSPIIDGNTVTWSSSGSIGYKGSKKGTPYAAQLAAADATRKAQNMGLSHARHRHPRHRLRPGAGHPLHPGHRRERPHHHRRHPQPAQRLPSAQAEGLLSLRFRAP
jgi:hypothetical protein